MPRNFPSKNGSTTLEKSMFGLRNQEGWALISTVSEGLIPKEALLTNDPGSDPKAYFLLNSSNHSW